MNFSHKLGLCLLPLLASCGTAGGPAPQAGRATITTMPADNADSASDTGNSVSSQDNNSSIANNSSQAIGPNDIFEVRVYHQPDLSSTYRVGPDGTIQFPLVGHLEVKGKTAAEVAAQIRDALSGDYLVDPQVSVFVKELNSQKISVFGEVSKPGTFTYVDGMNVIQAVTLAEGYTKDASRKAITVTRTINGQEMRIEIKVDDILKGISKNFELKPGDIVFVPQSLF